MTMIVQGLIGTALALATPGGDAQRAPRMHGDQGAAMEARMMGRLLPLREIERRIVPTMSGARYIGFDFDSGAAVYTLKFLRDGSVIWVVVDGRSGQVVGRSGR
jgi:uncharacterized membrane protein YkoI